MTAEAAASLLEVPTIADAGLEAASSTGFPPPYPAPSRPPAISDGTVLAGRYRLGARLGEGGSADVYEGEDLRLGRRVAVKILGSFYGDASREGRFQEEARLLAKLDHSRLVRLYDAGMDGPLPYLVMPLVSGSTLAALISNGPRHPWQVCQIGIALAEGLSYVHAQGIVHRDVKPSNVLLDRHGGVFLSDFGIAHAVDGPDLTATDCVVGTAGYLAPEQAEGSSATPASDAYALGLLLLEALKGEPEYTGTPLERTIASVTTPPCVPSTWGAAWRSLLTRLTSRDPAERPAAAGVRDFLASAPVPRAGRTAFAPVARQARQLVAA